MDIIEEIFKAKFMWQDKVNTGEKRSFRHPDKCSDSHYLVLVRTWGADGKKFDFSECAKFITEESQKMNTDSKMPNKYKFVCLLSYSQVSDQSTKALMENYSNAVIVSDDQEPELEWYVF